jgi:hypothetical protein
MPSTISGLTINTRSCSLQHLISIKFTKVLAACVLTYWPSHQGRNPDFLDFFISNLPNYLQTKLTNQNDPAPNHTLVILHINTSFSLHNNNDRSRVICPRFRNIISRNSHINFKLKSSANIDTAIRNFTETIHNSKINASFLAHKFKSDYLITSKIRKLFTQKR